MTFMLTCDCPAPTSTCSLEEALKAALEADVAFTGLVAIYTGGMATAADTANQGPALPYCVLSDLGPNNSTILGEHLAQYEVLVRFRFYTVTDKQGLDLARAAAAAVFGQHETADGYACRSRLPARARPLKLGQGQWMTQMNQLFYIHNAV